ncbi:nuclear transport factor 2 family protein [Sphingosinicella soli]|uniref:SnoaL-like domain-containing protein n=1 Tax=Sphingosinicella soli TaxID=333708 RepID=A0A7W7F7K3_9SPHN|nr:nuclear transport factor 2 family protein [Sphingosinicella soli]MBB4632692.1 hypothetical protein [Sphingosinicella soli]
MLSLQQISDRLEIQDLVAAYSAAVDSSDWDGLDAVFTPDAIIDYTEVGGPRGDLSTIKAYLARVMPEFKSFQHMTGPTQLTIRNDGATGRTIVFNPIVFSQGENEHVLFVGLWYCDTFVRVENGWRIRERREERCYMHNMPGWFVQQPA